MRCDVAFLFCRSLCGCLRGFSEDCADGVDLRRVYERMKNQAGIVSKVKDHLPICDFSSEVSRV